MIGIYSFRNKLNQKRYIGKSVDIESRYKGHIRTVLKNKVKSYFYNALNKYGIDNFDFEVLIECPKENLDYWEKFYIKYYCSNNHKYGYNETNGGDGHSGEPWNKGLNKEIDERVKKMSISMKNNKRDMSGENNPFYCHKHTKETVEIIRTKNTGKKQSKETIEKRKLNTDWDKLRNRKRTTEQRNNISNGTKNGMHNPEKWEHYLLSIREANKRKIGSKYMNNGIERKLVKPNDIEYYLSNGWIFGRNIS